MAAILNHIPGPQASSRPRAEAQEREHRHGREPTGRDTALQDIGSGGRLTAAQVMLRWHLQEGRSAIPTSVRPERIAENFAVFDFTLTDDELESLDTGVRHGPEPEEVSLEAYGRPIPEA
ncbi:hypothetical protein GCM10022221_65950 [Actinocorallia aurea]